MLFTVGIMEQSLTREVVGSDNVAYCRRVRADSRAGALGKCLPDIVENVLPLCDTSIVFVSVYIGRKGSVTGAAFRLAPVQIVRATGKRRFKRQ